MGRKVNPIGFRLKVNRTCDGRWYAEGDDYVEHLQQDIKLREMIREEAPHGEKRNGQDFGQSGKVKVIVHTAKPGVFIGRKGENIKKVRSTLEAVVGMKIDLDIKEIKSPDMDALLVAENIAGQLERRISFSRAMKRAIRQTMRQGAEGIRVQVAGRLSGAEMARTIHMREGRVPRQTLRANIDYAITEALTSYGRVGVKVWIYKGEILSTSEESPELTEGVYVSK